VSINDDDDDDEMKNFSVNQAGTRLDRNGDGKKIHRCKQTQF